VKELFLYALFLLSLLLSRFKGLDWLPLLVLVSPLFFLKEEELGLRNWKRGLLFGLPFTPLGVPYLFKANCFGFLLNQAGLAFAEELFFRGFLMRRLSNLTVSALFALSHFTYWSSLNALLTFFPSLLFGHLYGRSGSLLAPFLAHYSLNLFYFYLRESFPELFGLLNAPLF